jgi:peptide/nickel transport system substrate-binding protein
LRLNRYFAVFYNLDKEIFKDKDLRGALEISINKKEIKNRILKNQAILLDSPFFFLEEENYQYDPEKAKELIKNKNISFTLSLPEDYQLIKVAQFLKEEWQKIGVNVELEILPIKELEREVILPKNYEALLFGEIVDLSFDLFPFWHSSQAGPYKLNLSSFKSKDLDGLIEENWNADENKKMEIFQKMREIFQKENPALFLYNPYYLYVLPKKVQGHNIERVNIPAEIFSDVSYWYIKVERVLKW